MARPAPYHDRRESATMATYSVTPYTTKDVARFLRFLQPADGGCLEWTGALRPNGYGVFVLRKPPRWIPAHRFAFVIGGGLFPEEKPFCLHRCDNPLCCLFEHLYAGTQAENNQDMALRRRGRRSRNGLPYGAMRQANGRFQARVSVGHRYFCFGTYDTADEASAVAWRERQRIYHSGS